MRMGLSYQQASDNSNRIGQKAYDEVIKSGGSISEAQEAYRLAYEEEMKWYES
jgi:hypothetical protein